MFKNYDVIVVGAGHAGCEAAAAAANLGSSVLLVTMNMQTIAQMSCNPAMGGIAKGQIVREIDALGGYSGIVSDKTAIQFRMLNRSKGPAMWSPRVQSDRLRFAEEWRLMLENTTNVDFWQDMVKELIVEDGKAVGVVTGMGLSIRAKAVVLTNGTFLNGIIHIGEKQFGGGRASESASKGITEQLVTLGFESGRMKTGTPPRIDGRSLDYSKMEEQKGDENPDKFSFLPNTSAFQSSLSNPKKKQNKEVALLPIQTMQFILFCAQASKKSPMFQGRIKGLGPRYCPSIEDKITRFAERERHQIFVEPEGWNTIEIYVNGFSTSLPEEVQYKALKLISGFENVKMFRPGYAIEYDYFPPHQLHLNLETKLISNLFFAGQINGTTGYEEAACQGLMAGINAHLKVNAKPAFILQRSEAYIGVLIDDLVTKGTDEPYRMFTSRAEYRILLRQDNADIRLTPKSFELGLASEERMKRVEIKMKAVKEITNYFKQISAEPNIVNSYLESQDSTPINQKIKYFNILSRPNVSILGLLTCDVELQGFTSKYDSEIIEQAEILMKYEGYIEKEQEMVDKQSRLESLELSHISDYKTIPSLSLEAKDKLNKVRPKTIGQASRISGISPADISVLMIFMGR